MAQFRCNTCHAQGDIVVAGDDPITCPSCGAADVAVLLDRSEGGDIKSVIRGLLKAKLDKPHQRH